MPKSKNSLLQSFGLVFPKVEMEGFWISWPCQEGRENYSHNWHGESSGHSTKAPPTTKIESPPINNGSSVDQFSPHDHSCHTIHWKCVEIYKQRGRRAFQLATSFGPQWAHWIKLILFLHQHGAKMVHPQYKIFPTTPTFDDWWDPLKYPCI